MSDFDAFEAAGWEATAEAYGRAWPALTDRLSDPLLDAVGAGPGTRLLDVACGPGHLTARALERGAAPMGLDIAEPMVEIARRRVPGADFRQGDAHALPFPDGSFDAVVGSLALPHLGRPERATSELHRVLGPGGQVALATWDRPDRARLVGVLLEAVREVGVAPPPTVPAGPDFFRFADDGELTALLEGAAFVDVEVDTVTLVHRVANGDELWDAMLHGTVRTSAVLRAQPDEVVDAVRRGFDRRLQDHRTGDAYELPVSFKLGRARRD